MIPKTRKQWIGYIALLVAAMLLLWVTQLEDDSQIKSMLRHFIKAIVRAF